MFNFKHIKGDLFGGITAGIVALPLGLAFGVSSGMGAAAGLYGAIFVSFFAALFGGTSTQISGPTAPMTAVSMVVIAKMIADNGSLEAALPAILSVFLLAGLMQICLGLAGFGKYIRYIPYPVVSGFMTAIGVIILVTQILPAIGYTPSDDTAYVKEFNQEANGVILADILKDESDGNFYVSDHFSETAEKGQEINQEKIDEESKTLAAKNASGVIGTFRVLPRALQNIKWLEVLNH